MKAFKNITVYLTNLTLEEVYHSKYFPIFNIFRDLHLKEIKY